MSQDKFAPDRWEFWREIPDPDDSLADGLRIDDLLVFKDGEPYWTIKGEGTDAQLVEHTYSDDIGLDGMAEQDGYEERYYVTHHHAWLALQKMHHE